MSMIDQNNYIDENNYKIFDHKQLEKYIDKSKLLNEKINITMIGKDIAIKDKNINNTVQRFLKNNCNFGYVDCIYKSGNSCNFKTYHVILANERQRILGYFQLVIGPVTTEEAIESQLECGEIWSVCVENDYRSKGIAKIMLVAIIEYTKLSKYWLAVSLENPLYMQAVGVYSSLGFFDPKISFRTPLNNPIGGQPVVSLIRDEGPVSIIPITNSQRANNVQVAKNIFTSYNIGDPIKKTLSINTSFDKPYLFFSNTSLMIYRDLSSNNYLVRRLLKILEKLINNSKDIDYFLITFESTQEISTFTKLTNIIKYNKLPIVNYSPVFTLSHIRKLNIFGKNIPVPSYEYIINYTSYPNKNEELKILKTFHNTVEEKGALIIYSINVNKDIKEVQLDNYFNFLYLDAQDNNLYFEILPSDKGMQPIFLNKNNNILNAAIKKYTLQSASTVSIPDRKEYNLKNLNQLNESYISKPPLNASEIISLNTLLNKIVNTMVLEQNELKEKIIKYNTTNVIDSTLTGDYIDKKSFTAEIITIASLFLLAYTGDNACLIVRSGVNILIDSRFILNDDFSRIGYSSTEKLIPFRWVNGKLFVDPAIKTTIETNCTNNRIIIIPLGISGPTEGHANVLIYDKMSKTVERIEPHGEAIHRSDTVLTSALLDTYLENYFKSEIDPQIKYLSPQASCPNMGPQIIETSGDIPLSEDEPRGYCVYWSLFITLLRLKYPNVNSKNLQENIMKFIYNTPLIQGVNVQQKYRNFIGMFANFTVYNISKIQDKCQDIITAKDFINCILKTK